MDFAYTEKVETLRRRVQDFMDRHVYPNEAVHRDQQAAMADRWQPVPIIEELKPQAREPGCGTLSAATRRAAPGLTNLEYAPLAEIMGRVAWASEVFNCSAPDTGNMEMLDRYGTDGAEARMAGAAARRRDPLRVLR